MLQALLRFSPFSGSTPRKPGFFKRVAWLVPLVFHLSSLTLVGSTSFQGSDSPKAATIAKPRVVFLNDIPPLDVIPTSVGSGPAEKISDPDSLQSAIRFLLYANEFDVEALIQTSGTWANIADRQNVVSLLDVYAEVFPNLLEHDSRYPTPEKLKEITFKGLDGTWGARDINKVVGEGKDSEASQAIIRIVDQEDTRPVWFCCGGGSCDIAQAIWRVQHTRNSQELDAFLSKIRIYVIAKQDCSTQWLLDNFPNLFVILSEKNYLGMFWYSWGSNPVSEDATWVKANLSLSQGPLAAAYPRTGADASKPGVVEGDSPSFLHLLSAVRGINDPEQPSQWGWGGKFVQPNPAKKHWYDHSLGGEAVWHWRSDFQADFATRISWMSKAVIRSVSVSGNQLTDTLGNNVRLVGWHQTTGAWFSGYGKFFKNGDADGCSLYLRRVVNLFTDPSPRYGYDHGWHFNQVRLGSSEDFHGSYIKNTFNLAGFKQWVDRVLVPFVAYCETKGVYVTVFPDVGVPEHSTTSTLQDILIKSWDYVSSHPQLRNKGNLMFELCNEPIAAQAPDGTWGDDAQKYHDVLKNWLQPIVDKIRSNGAQNVIWVPGLGYQSHFEGYAANPMVGDNLGYAVHIYPGYWHKGGAVGNDVKRVRSLWNDRYAPVAKFAPINITESWWLKKQPGDDAYWGLFDGFQGTNDNGFGAELFRIIEDQGNVSMCLHHSMTLLGKGPTAEVSDPEGELGWQQPNRDSAVLPFFHRQYLWRNWGLRSPDAPAGPSKFTNLSVRSGVGNGNDTFIVGFYVAADSPDSKLPLLLRAAGPSLSAFSIASPLVDPVLTVFAEKEAIDSNDNWAGAATLVEAGRKVGAFPFESEGSYDSALQRSFDRGAYTFHIRSVTGDAGVALGELYDTEGNDTSSLATLSNISARSKVGVESNVLIAGFSIGGASKKTVLIRGVGPSLAALFNIEGALAEPSLQLFSESLKLQESHVWRLSSDAVSIEATAKQVGAFPLSPDSKDSAILCSLEPGNYTAILSGVGSTTGVGLIEVYEVR